MSTPTGSNLYSQGFGTTSSNSMPGNAIVKTVAPTTSDIRGPNGPYTVGQLWVDSVGEASYQLASFSALNGVVTANWISLGGGATSLDKLDGDSGPGATPTAGAIIIAGGAGVTTSATGSTVTIALSGGGQAIDSVNVGAATAPGTNPVLPDGTGAISVLAAVTAAGTTPVQTNSLAASTYTVQVQTSQAIAATDATKIGLCNFDSAQFSVDANGFVALSASLPVVSKNVYLPNLEFGGASTGITYSTQSGDYLVIGTPGSGNALVIATGFIVLSSKGTATGNASISNLPYACYSFQAIGAANAAQAFTIDAGYANVFVRANQLSTSMDILEGPAAGTASGQILSDTNFSATTGLSYTIIYQA